MKTLAILVCKNDSETTPNSLPGPEQFGFHQLTLPVWENCPSYILCTPAVWVFIWEATWWLGNWHWHNETIFVICQLAYYSLLSICTNWCNRWKPAWFLCLGKAKDFSRHCLLWIDKLIGQSSVFQSPKLQAQANRSLVSEDSFHLVGGWWHDSYFQFVQFVLH